MREVFGAVVVIGIVLVAVFVPVAFFPGTTGRLYQQFSLTIAFATILSVFNAVTLTPALSALLLDKHSHKQGRFFTRVNRGIDARHQRLHAGGREGAAVAHRDAALFVVGLLGTWAVFHAVPSAFVPQEDEGYFMTIIQAPPARRWNTRPRSPSRPRKYLLGRSGNRGRLLGAGIQLRRRRAEQRDDVRAAEGLGRTARTRINHSSGVQRAARSAVRHSGRDRRVVSAASHSGPVGLRRVPVRSARPDRRGHQRLAAATQALIARGNQSGRVAGLFTSFRADDPQLVVEHRSRSRAQPRSAIARSHRRAAGVPRIAVRRTTSTSRIARIASTRRPISATAPTPRSAAAVRTFADRGDGAARHRRAAAARRRRRR